MPTQVRGWFPIQEGQGEDDVPWDEAEPVSSPGIGTATTLSEPAPDPEEPRAYGRDREDNERRPIGFWFGQ
jgi:hypothetical protein